MSVPTRTKPSPHAMDCLARALLRPFPAQEVNPSVCGKLVAAGYAIYEDRPSPYRTHKPGRKVPFLVATDAGREALASAESKP